MTPRAAAHPHPPLDFNLVGLRASACERRWVEFLDGQPVCSVALGHLVIDEFLIVRTAPQGRWHERMEGGPVSSAPAEAALASRGLAILLDAARPELDDAERGAYNRRIVFAAEAIGERWHRWDEATWQVDGRPSAARVLQVGRNWCGVTKVESDRYVGVTAFNSTDPVVSLEGVDGSAYGFDFTVPFGIASSTTESRRTRTSRGSCEQVSLTTTILRCCRSPTALAA